MATDGTNVVAFFGSEGLYCYDLAGNLRWKKDLGILRASPVVYNDTRDPNGATLEWGFASSPILHDHRVFLQCDVLTNGFVAAYDLADGKEVWRTRRDDTATWSTPNICAEGGRLQLVVNGWNHMGGYDLATGAEIWQMAGGGDCPVPTPMVGKGLIFFMSAHGPRKPIYAVRTDAVGDVSLRGGAGTNAHVAWSALQGGSYMQTPLLYDHYLYTCQNTGVLSCYEAATGSSCSRNGWDRAGTVSRPRRWRRRGRFILQASRGRCTSCGRGRVSRFWRPIKCTTCAWRRRRFRRERSIFARRGRWWRWAARGSEGGEH